MSNGQMPLSEWAKLPFGDASEMIAAISDPRYESYIYPNNYRAAVEQKIGISEGCGTDNVRSLGVEHSVTIGTDSLTAAEDQAAIEREFAATRPDQPMAVDSNKIQ
jgi:hypothetical protein